MFAEKLILSNYVTYKVRLICIILDFCSIIVKRYLQTYEIKTVK